MFALALSGAWAGFTDASPQSVSALIPVWAADAWGFIMFFGGVLSISSSFWQDRITGLLIERLALGAIGGTCAFYALALALVYGMTNGVLNIALFISISVACVWRIVHVRRELHLLSRWIGWTNEGV